MPDLPAHERDRSPAPLASPLRDIVAVERDERRVLMDRLSCGHLLTHQGDADCQGRRRCAKCRRKRCVRCGDDGWIELFDDDENVVGAADCPDLNEPWHLPFNHTGLLGATK